MSAGRIIEPFVQAVGPSVAASPLASLNVWRRKRRNQNAHTKAMYELSRMDKGFRLDTFLSGATSGYKSIIDGISSGQWANVAPLVTEQCLASLRRGAEISIAETGYLQGATIVEQVETPALVQASVASLNGELGRSLMEPPDVAQLVVRMTTLQAAKAIPASGGEAKARPALDEAATLGEWSAVEDPGSGHVYYVNSATGAAQWTRPGPKQWATGRVPFRIETAGILRSLVSDHPAAAAGGVPVMRVVHHVTWERVVRPGAPAIWRVAKM